MNKVLEIISKYIEQLEEELEWYQAKNREWQEENARLREQLRWHPVYELPRREIQTSFLSVDVFLDIIGQGIYKAYHSNWSNTWVDRRSNKVIVVPTNHDSRWCYIPDDNQGTDCTPEDGDE